MDRFQCSSLIANGQDLFCDYSIDQDSIQKFRVMAKFLNHVYCCLGVAQPSPCPPKKVLKKSPTKPTAGSSLASLVLLTEILSATRIVGASRAVWMTDDREATASCAVAVTARIPNRPPCVCCGVDGLHLVNEQSKCSILLSRCVEHDVLAQFRPIPSAVVERSPSD